MYSAYSCLLTAALHQAKEGRAHILGEMTKALGSARTELSAHAPRIETLQIDKSKIREVIGTGGKVIREIVAETGAKVDIDDEGVIKISSSNVEEIEAAKKWILGIVEEAEVGKIYNGKVVNIVDFGAFVNFMGGKDGLVHVSEMRNERVEKPTDVVSEGMEVKVKVLEIDQRGKVRLSMRVVDQETGAELEDTRPPREAREPREGGRGGDRGGDRRGPKGGGGGRGGDRGGRWDNDRGGNWQNISQRKYQLDRRIDVGERPVEDPAQVRPPAAQGAQAAAQQLTALAQQLPSLLPQALHSLLETMKLRMMKQTLMNLSRLCQLQNHQRWRSCC